MLNDLYMRFAERQQHFSISRGQNRMNWTLISSFSAIQILDSVTVVAMVLCTAVNTELK